jgi:hypothetical protein
MTYIHLYTHICTHAYFVDVACTWDALIYIRHIHTQHILHMGLHTSMLLIYRIHTYIVHVLAHVTAFNVYIFMHTYIHIYIHGEGLAHATAIDI